MAKFVLDPNPTFKSKVTFHIPGDTVTVEFEFKYRNGDEREKYRQEISVMSEKGIVHLLKETIVGWELEDEFNDANLEKMHCNYPEAWLPIVHKYMDEIGFVKQKN